MSDRSVGQNRTQNDRNYTYKWFLHSNLEPIFGQWEQILFI